MTIRTLRDTLLTAACDGINQPSTNIINLSKSVTSEIVLLFEIMKEHDSFSILAYVGVP